MNYYSSVNELKNAITALVVQFPDMANDDLLLHDMIIGCTDVEEVTGKILASIREDEILTAGIEAVTLPLQERHSRHQRRIEAKRHLLQTIMERSNLKKLTLPEATISLSNPKPSPFILNDEAVPDELCKIVTTRKPDLKKIKEAIAAGQMPAGVSLSNSPPTLTIRRA